MVKFVVIVENMFLSSVVCVNWGYLLLVLFLSSTNHKAAFGGSTDTTKGFVSVPLNQSSFVIQKPYDVPQEERYSFVDGVHKLWVFATDKPLSKSSHTNPRTEIRIHGHDYSSGVLQFEASGYVPKGTTGVCIMQVFGASPHATTLMLRVYNGSLSYYRTPVIIPHIYDKWFRLNVIHDVDASKLQIYINGVLKHEALGRGGKSHYFKCGVYAQDDYSHYMESRWKDIKILTKVN